jgi:HNH endonuclease/NUMOD4 motif
MSEWRTVPGYTAYEVSESGDVRRIESYPAHLAGRLMSPYLDEDGYLALNLRRAGSGGRKKFFIHQLVALAFISERPSVDHEVAHGDGVKSNNHFSNLRWATRTENENDKLHHGTHNRGERHGRAQLTEEQVIEIRQRNALGKVNLRELAREFGVTHYVIFDVVHGRSWKYLLEAA